MQAAGTTAKQINVIVCSHMCWQGACLFWRGEGQLPLGGGGVIEKEYSFYHVAPCWMDSLS